MLTNSLTRTRNQASPDMQFTPSLSCNAAQLKLVSDVSVQHNDTIFRDQAIQVDSRSQLNM